MHSLPPGPNNYWWRDYFTNPNLNTGDIAVIQDGDNVYLDELSMPVPDLKLIIVRGSLIFDKCGDGLKLDAASILVEDAGTLQIGKANDRFTNKATITLIDADPPTESDLTNNNVSSDTETREALKSRGLVICNNGQLLLFGDALTHSWLRLNAKAAVDDEQITLDASPNWLEDDEIVIASTDFQERTAFTTQAENRVLTEDVTGTIAKFTGDKLIYEHWGTEESFEPVAGVDEDKWKISERAEVGLLTRNILITGEESEEDTDGDGNPDFKSRGHVFFHNEDLPGDPAPTIKLSWVEFDHLGIEGNLARYPVHFHQLGDIAATGSFVKFCSVRRSLNRGIVIHNTGNLTVEGNVLYDIIGRAIYFEGYYTDTSGVPLSQDCLIKDNLGLYVERSTLEIGNFEADDDVAVFYLRNPRNKFEGNVAAGSRQYGFYMAPNLDDVGWTWNSQTSNSYFKNNMAHSCKLKGIYQDTEGGAAEQLLEGCKVYKIREHGIWVRAVTGVAKIVGDSTSTDPKDWCWIADCRAGIYPATLGLRGWGQGRIVMDDCLFVGESSNLGNPNLVSAPWEDSTFSGGSGRSLAQPSPELISHDMYWDVLCGVENYDGINEVKNSRFAEFNDIDLSNVNGVDYDYRFAAAFSQVPQYADWALDPRNFVENLTLNKVQRGAYFRDAGFGGATYDPHVEGNNQIACNILVDKDDSLDYASTSGNETLLMAYTPFLVEVEAPPAALKGTNDQASKSTTDDSMNGYIVDASEADYAQLVVEIVDSNPSNAQAKMKVRRDFNDGQNVNMRTWGSYDFTALPQKPIENQNDEFPLNLTTGTASSGSRQYYVVEWDNASNLPKELKVKFRFTESLGEVVYIEIPFPEDPFLNGGMSLDQNDVVTHTIDRITSGIGSLLSDPGDHLYYYDSTNSRLVLKLTARLLFSLSGQNSVNDGVDVMVNVN